MKRNWHFTAVTAFPNSEDEDISTTGWVKSSTEPNPVWFDRNSDREVLGDLVESKTEGDAWVFRFAGLDFDSSAPTQTILTFRLDTDDDTDTVVDMDDSRSGFWEAFAEYGER